MSDDQEKIRRAVNIGCQFGQIYGAHHRLWVIDQMLRALLEERYDEAIAEISDENSPWDVGIEP